MLNKNPFGPGPIGRAVASFSSMNMNLFRSRVPQASRAENAQGMSFVEREGLSILTTQFDLPEDSIFLDMDSKRALTICNLFINHHLAVSRIAQLLEHDRGQVVQVLIQKKIVLDRRVKPSAWSSDVERRKHD